MRCSPVIIMPRACVVVWCLVYMGSVHARGHHIKFIGRDMQNHNIHSNVLTHGTHGPTNHNVLTHGTHGPTNHNVLTHGTHGPTNHHLAEEPTGHPVRQPHQYSADHLVGLEPDSARIRHHLTVEGMKMAAGHVTWLAPRPCPCKNSSWCHVVTNRPAHQTFVFSVHDANWRQYDWDKITTIATFTYFDDDLMCWAHSRGAKLVHAVDFPKNQLCNSTARHTWTSGIINMMKLNFLDGVNVDFEDHISDKEQAEREGLTLLMKELTQAVKQLSPNTQITFDFTNCPNAKGRYYDYKAIADVIDFAFVMDYDEYYGTYGGANAPYDVTKRGLEQFIADGVPSNKLVLGAPWYGFSYNCTTYNQSSEQCKWSSRRQAGYSDVVKDLAHSFTGRLWDDTAQSPYCAYKSADDHYIYQLWYDDPESLKIKFNLIESLGLLGAGNWESDSLNYSDPIQVREMWGAFP